MRTAPTRTAQGTQRVLPEWAGGDGTDSSSAGSATGLRSVDCGALVRAAEQTMADTYCSKGYRIDRSHCSSVGYSEWFDHSLAER